ncbi:hypothetical protein UY3_08338 [Chelonia mydas]|uniref:Uncharacterized protein n=1 Tax=Chelonia mydas TaxID=8469 RepID=M7BBG0_CHEMY|nr:hypothetical protein UY3_08338 [Chelonia mydas]
MFIQNDERTCEVDSRHQESRDAAEAVDDDNMEKFAIETELIYKSRRAACSKAVWPPSKPEGKEPPSLPKWAEPSLPCPSHQMYVAGTGSIKGGASHSVGAETLREAEGSCSLPAMDPTAEPSNALPTRELASAMDLLGLLWATYPEKPETAPLTQVDPERRQGSGPGIADLSLATALPEDSPEYAVPPAQYRFQFQRRKEDDLAEDAPGA